MSEPIIDSPETPSLQSHSERAFNDAIAAITRHNEEYGLAHGMAKSLFGIFEARARKFELMEQGHSEADAESIADKERRNRVPLNEEQKMAHDILQLTNSDILDSLGLRLTPMRGEFVMFSQEGDQEIGPVQLQLVDSEKFSHFLVGIETATDELRENVTSVVKSLLTELSDAIDEDKDKDFILETLSGADAIVKGLEHIGLGDSPIAKNLAEYFKHAKQGDVFEWVAAMRMQLLRKPEEQQFGPSQWHRDSSSEMLTQRWDGIVHLLEKTRENPRAQELFRELLANANLSLERAREDWARLRKDWAAAGHGNATDGIFNEVAVRLAKLGSDEVHK